MAQTPSTKGRIATPNILRVVDNLETILAPILPHTAQKLHEYLGYEGQLFGRQQVVEYEEETRTHEALTYDHSSAIGTWTKSALPPGQGLREPAPLFKKLDESVIEEEYARGWKDERGIGKQEIREPGHVPGFFMSNAKMGVGSGQAGLHQPRDWHNSSIGRLPPTPNAGTMDNVTGFSAEYRVLSTYRGAQDLDLAPIILRGSLASDNLENIKFVESISNIVSYGVLKKGLG